MTDTNTTPTGTTPSSVAQEPTMKPTTTAEAPARSLTSDAWLYLRRRPLFWVSTIMIITLVLMAIAPSLFAHGDPYAADLSQSRAEPSAEAWFGRDIQGADIYTLTIYGARASILVGVLTTIATLLIGAIVGTLAAYFGGIWDTLLMRVTDVFFAIPMLLGGILFMTSFPNPPDASFWVVVGKVVLVLSLFGWPSIARLMRGAILQIKDSEYVMAARALGAGTGRIIFRHLLPNAFAPALVVSTINLGTFIAAEATLSFLGIGLTSPAISWGLAISTGTDAIYAAPHILLFPSLFLSITVLAFILLGDAVRDAFDPKAR
ncbi:Glutathione transport system permease protein gsiD [Dermatophilus congolensis]|uniref:Glutathione transport system permease protein gsiD n=1 Tax=Dermatophilus congolensis TaxID=1863 RepID=A0AA46BM74_9MICO|nr:ABC transporter permease [Dermatophilus congolensis]STD06358.1 Glutathione transport system permease protein gsiD [Dermatophilus congolensis]